MAMNDVVTPHQLVCLYSAAGGGELPGRLHSLSGGSSDAWNIIIVSRQRAQGRCFRTFGIPKPSSFSRIELVTKNDPAPRRATVGGLLLYQRSSKQKHLRQDDIQAGTI
jgi:hypothetical protein